MGVSHKLVVGRDGSEAASLAADEVARRVRHAVTKRGVATLAVSGGTTAAALFDALCSADVPWPSLHIFQVDERVAANDDADRNSATLTSHLTDRVGIPPDQVHLINVGTLSAGAAAQAYRFELRSYWTRKFDVVHLGLGDDGHTASLVPGDPVLDVQHWSVATTRSYKARRRVTLTFPTINRARHLVWLATGSSKAVVVPRLLAQDASIPAGAVRPALTSTIYVDAAAAAQV